MKKKILCVVICGIICLGLSACGKHVHSHAKADCNHPGICIECNTVIEEALGHTTTIGVCSRCGEVQNAEVIRLLNGKFSEIMETGSEMMSLISKINTSSNEEKYRNYKSAGKYSAQIKKECSEIMDVCASIKEMVGLVYQLRLLINVTPSQISGDDTVSLNNQSFQYQIYLHQISSSFSYFSKYMDFLAGNTKLPEGEKFFECEKRIPTPDSIIYGITYDSSKTEAGNIQYTYRLGDNENDATMNYNIFLLAIDMSDELEVEITNTYALVTYKGNVISAMMAGEDLEKGFFLTISFQK